VLSSAEPALCDPMQLSCFGVPHKHTHLNVVAVLHESAGYVASRCVYERATSTSNAMLILYTLMVLHARRTCRHYHASLTAEQREAVQSAWSRDELQVQAANRWTAVAGGQQGRSSCSTQLLLKHIAAYTEPLGAWSCCILLAQHCVG
jgi:hypothetical protein